MFKHYSHEVGVLPPGARLIHWLLPGVHSNPSSLRELLKRILRTDRDVECDLAPNSCSDVRSLSLW